VSYDLGIDVGTSYTAAAISDDAGIISVVGLGPITDSIPTVLYLDEDGSMVAGDAANRKALLDPSGSSREFKRRLGDPTPSLLRGAPFSAEALIARMLRHVVERVVERQRSEPRRVAVCHPANWGPYKMELFGQALRMADLDEAVLISEPAAAATSYASETRVMAGSTFAVYDLGGGTFDAAIVRKSEAGFEIVGEPVGLEHLGGMDFDQAVLDHVRSELGSEWVGDPDDAAELTAMSHLRRSCMEAKELLSSESSVAIPVLLPGVEGSIELSRAELEARIRPSILSSVDALDQAITRAGEDASALSAILLVGGSSRIPLVSQVLQERFGALVAVDVDPIHAVAKGAAIAAAVSAEGSSGDKAGAAQPAAAQPVVTTPPQPPSPPAPAKKPTPAPAPQESVQPAAEPSSPPTPAPTPTPAATPIPQPTPGPTTEPLQPAPAMAASGRVAAPVGAVPVSAPGGSVDDSGLPIKRLALIALPVLALVAAAAFFLTRPGDENVAIAPSADQSGSDAGTDPEVEEGEGTDDPEAETPVVATSAMSAPGDGMVEVQAGTYPLGLDQPESNSSETISRTVDLNAFFIDTLEVSNADYKNFLDQTAAEPPAGWRAGQYPADLADHPVRGVSFEWAAAFCASSAKRLPTEAEWEVAARGADGRVWPWGDDASVVQLPGADTYVGGSIPGNVSPFGVFDMTGNVWEWVSDSYDARVSADQRVLRGGQNGFLRETVTRLPVDPIRSSSLNTAGLRCAADGIDPAAQPGTFLAYDAPPRPNAPEEADLPEGVLVFDDFTDSTSGWTEAAVEGEFRRGYHPNEFLHLETRDEFKEALALAPWRSNPDEGFSISTSSFVQEGLTSESGTFAQGLAFNFDDEGNGLIFIVDERTSLWQLCSRSVSGQGPFGPNGAEYEVIEQATRAIPPNATLEVVSLGDDKYQFKIDGSVVHTRTIPGFNGTGAGLVLLSYAGSEKAHIHFNEFQVNGIN